ncbi:hypothetical protein LTR84_001902 [Exophiala bonariae]|uniref:Xylanolytic transcriptional activator regulatory domain-containing protein n=1 Tax=Exophiala bonariae TaxID=1690606 RepID=A0AAV9NBP0_9EURO|nr:hypothetical protein LTR84_001902 [Exophiala bonariae]
MRVSMRKEKHKYIRLLRRLKLTPQDEIQGILESIALPEEDYMEDTDITSTQPTSETPEVQTGPGDEDEDGSPDSPESMLDVSTFLSVDDKGSLNPIGPSSALHSKVQLPGLRNALDITHIKNQLVANAILTRQGEIEIYDKISHVDQVPIELAMHLLNLHWNRQHHSFLLTYRPAVMRDLVSGGQYSSKFMMNAIFACASKFSDRLDIREDINNPLTAGARFFRRCNELLGSENLLLKPSIPTVVGLLLLGSTYNARGEVSKGWLLTGYGLRMIYDLGLHLDRDVTLENAEEIEIRRRVFWGAFINDKLQSLYLGRPIAIHIQDTHVSLDFMDVLDEREPWIPYNSASQSYLNDSQPKATPKPMYSVSCFREFCRLSKIMTRIINNFYVIGSNAASAKASLKGIEDSLTWWKENLSPQLRLDTLTSTEPFPPSTSTPILTTSTSNRNPTPNILHLHGIYHSLIILLYRPFVTGGHLLTTTSSTSSSPSTNNSPAHAWQHCTSSAKSITALATHYQTQYTLRGAPYLLSYAVYVACTIHVRNVAASAFAVAAAAGVGAAAPTAYHEQANSRSSSAATTRAGVASSEHCAHLAASLRCLDELTLPNPGVSRPAKIIRALMASLKVADVSAVMGGVQQALLDCGDEAALGDSYNGGGGCGRAAAAVVAENAHHVQRHQAQAQGLEREPQQEFDLDAIISGFTATTTTNTNSNNALGGESRLNAAVRGGGGQMEAEIDVFPSGGWFMPGHTSQHDLLYGFMDVGLPDYEPFVLEDGEVFGMGDAML